MNLKDLRHLTQEKVIELQLDDDVIADFNRDDDISIREMLGELFLIQKELHLIYEYDYYNNAEPTGAAWAWDSYFAEKPTDFEKVLRSECGLMLEC